MLKGFAGGLLRVCEYGYYVCNDQKANRPTENCFGNYGEGALKIAKAFRL